MGRVSVLGGAVYTERAAEPQSGHRAGGLLLLCCSPLSTLDAAGQRVGAASVTERWWEGSHRLLSKGVRLRHGSSGGM